MVVVAVAWASYSDGGPLNLSINYLNLMMSVLFLKSNHISRDVDAISTHKNYIIPQEKEEFTRQNQSVKHMNMSKKLERQKRMYKWKR